MPREVLELRVQLQYLNPPVWRRLRIRARVKQGGHPVPRADVLRRFERSWRNFLHQYRPLADAWAIYDNSGHHYCPVK